MDRTFHSVYMADNINFNQSPSYVVADNWQLVQRLRSVVRYCKLTLTVLGRTGSTSFHFMLEGDRSCDQRYYSFRKHGPRVCKISSQYMHTYLTWKRYPNEGYSIRDNMSATCSYSELSCHHAMIYLLVMTKTPRSMSRLGRVRLVRAARYCPGQRLHPTPCNNHKWCDCNSHVSNIFLAYTTQANALRVAHKCCMWHIIIIMMELLLALYPIIEIAQSASHY
jgi:hypothetical protein